MADASARFARKCGLREIYVHFGAFDFAFLCVVGPYERVEEYVAWKFEDERSLEGVNRNFSPRGRFFARDGYAPIIWIPKRPRTAREHGTLAHEIMHVVRHMFVDWVGMPLTGETDEAYCHALGHAVTTILEALDKK